MVQIAGSTPGTIQIKTRMTGAAGAPTSLASGEMAWNSVDKILYFGDGDNGSGVATSIVKLAGAGAFLLASLLGAASGIAPLDATGKVPLSYIPASVVGGLNYQGTWNAATNAPQLLSGQGTKGYYYKVSTAGAAVSTTVGTAQGSTGTVVNVASPAGIVPGMVAVANGVPTGDTVASVSGSNITLTSATTSALAAGTAITFATYLDGSGGGTATAPNFNPGDIVAYNGATWDKVDGPAEAVTSVAGRVGAVVLTAADITDASAVGRSFLKLTTVSAQRAALGIDAVTFVPNQNQTATATSFNYQFSSLTAARTFQLAPAGNVPAGTIVRIGDTSGACSSTNSITITADGTYPDSIGGTGNGSVLVLNSAGAQASLMSDGVSNWSILYQSGAPSKGVYGGSF